MPDHAANTRLFAYGTLLFEDIFTRVCGTRRQRADATLADFARLRVRGASYPALIASSGCQTQGVVYYDIENALWARLDAFEGPQYAREIVHVSVGEEIVAAATYVFQSAYAHLLDNTSWSPAWFARNALSDYLPGGR